MPDKADDILKLTTKIVSSYAGANPATPEELSEMIATVHAALLRAQAGETGPSHGQTPAVPIEDSLRDDALVCLEDGLEFQSLKRHLRVKYNLTPDAYREKWGLPRDYPMVAPDYARRRSALAKRSGLGKSAS